MPGDTLVRQSRDFRSRVRPSHEAVRSNIRWTSGRQVSPEQRWEVRPDRVELEYGIRRRFSSALHAAQMSSPA